MEVSLAMLRLAAETGTTDIAPLPTRISQFRYDRHRIQDIYADCPSRACIVRIHLGCDFHISFETCRTRWTIPKRYTINNHSYLMVELPDLVIVETAANVLYRLRGRE